MFYLHLRPWFWHVVSMRRRFGNSGLKVFLLCSAILLSLPSTRAQPFSAPPPAPAWRVDQFFVKPTTDVAPSHLSSFHAANGCKVIRTYERLHGLQLVQTAPHENLSAVIDAYQRSGLVDYAEPDFLRFLAAAPNDPKFVDGTLWALNNYGQKGGTPHADIDATNAWEILTSASNIVVAVLDSGIRYTHEDLAANMWTNPVDGSHGTNSIGGSSDPNDDNGHGTLMAGVIGALGNNGKGVTGVAWQVQLMACKCFSSNGMASDSVIMSSIDYARANGARIINASFSGTGFSQSLSNAIYDARQADIIFVAAAGNNSTPVNVDVTPYYPACYNIDNVVSVAFTTRTDTLGSISNYGATNVDLAAPGDGIYSTHNQSDSDYWPPPPLYGIYAGTSYSAAYVSGAFALMLAKYPTETHQQIISRLLNATDPLPSLAGKCVTGGRLNLRKALSPPISLSFLARTNSTFTFRVSAGPNRTCVIQNTSNLLNWISISTNTTSSAGTFDFTDINAFPHSVYRILSTP